MSWDSLEPNWADFVGKAKTRWGDLTDAELAEVGGQRDALAGRIQARYALAREEADRQIEDWMKEPGVLDDWNDRRPILDM